MDWYSLSRKIFDFAFEHKECGVYHVAIFNWACELNNRLGWKKEFWMPTCDICDGLSIWNKHTYLKALRDLEKWWFIKIIQESKNQFTATIIEICRINKDTATTTALDTALAQQGTRYWHAIAPIDKPINKETKKPINKTDAFDEFYLLYPKKIDKKDARNKFNIKEQEYGVDKIMEWLTKWKKLWSFEKTETKFIPSPLVWLNKEKFNDELSTPEVLNDGKDRLEEAKRRMQEDLVQFN